MRLSAPDPNGAKIANQPRGQPGVHPLLTLTRVKVARETQYFADPFEASSLRAQWVEPMSEKEVRIAK
jgi:hypothetical protein